MSDFWFELIRDHCDAQILDHLGDTVDYYPGGGPEFVTIPAQFKRMFESSDIGNAGAAASRPKVMIRAEYLVADPAERDKIVIPSVTSTSTRPRLTYRVIEKQPNGQGAFELFLQVQKTP